MTAAELMGLVREHLYIDRKAPDDYNDARDILILRHWLDRGQPSQDIADAIRGLGKMRDDGALQWIDPGEGITLRVLNPKVSRYNRHIAQTARDYWREFERRQYRAKHGMAMPAEDDMVAALIRAKERAS